MSRPLPESERPTFSKDALLSHEWIIPRLKMLLEFMNAPNGINTYLNQVEVMQAEMALRYKRFSYDDFKQIFDETLEEIKAGKYDKPETLTDDEEITENNQDEQNAPSESPSKKEPQLAEELEIDRFSVGASFMGPAPKKKWLVKNLIEEGQITGIVAAGGIGKTWIGLDIGLKLASSAPSDLFAFPVIKQCLTFFVTVEDSGDALRDRLETIDPDRNLRSQSKETFLILTADESFDDHFSLLEVVDKGKPKTTKSYRWLIEQIMEKRRRYPNMPVVVIFDTYSATHHSDENTALGATQWFRAASLLIKNFSAAVIVMHHIRKVGYNESLRNPDDFLAAIRGSNVFVNSCRRILGIWALKESEARKISSKKLILYNFSNVKDNNFADWSDIDVGAFNRPTITITKHEKGYLIFDRELNEKRKILLASKSALSEEQENNLMTHLLEVINFYAGSGYPLSKSIFDKQEGYANLLNPQYDQIPPKTIKAALQSLIDDSALTVAKIRINNKLCEIYDSPGGEYAAGRCERRTLIQMPESPFLCSDD